MAQQRTRSIQSISVEPSRNQNVFTEVVAQPVAVPERASVSSDTMGLIRGLSQLNEGLSQWGAEWDRDEQAKGRAAARAGTEKDEDSSSAFVKGYLEGSGEAAAIEDQAKLVEIYETQFPKDGSGDLEGFLAKFHQQAHQGAPDQRYLDGYNKQFGPAADALRKIHAEREVAAVLETHRANTQVAVDALISKYREGGSKDHTVFLSSFQQLMNDRMIPPSDRNDFLFATLNSLSERGDPEIWELAKKDRIDPKTGATIPSLYSIPSFRAKIDQAEQAAEAAQYAAFERQRREQERAREEAQDVALDTLFDAHRNGGMEAAQQVALALQQNKELFGRGNEILAIMKSLNEWDSAVTSATYDRSYNDWMNRIYTGRVSHMDIANAPNMDGATRARLHAELRTLTSTRRIEAREARAEARAIDQDKRAVEQARLERFRDPLFQETVRRLDGSMPPIPESATEFIFGGDKEELGQRYQMAAAQARQNIYRWWNDNPNATFADLEDYTTNSVNRFLERFSNEIEGFRAITAVEQQPYQDLDKLIQDYRLGRVDQITFNRNAKVLRSAIQFRQSGTSPNVP